MASSMLSGDRRWGQTRKTGMTVLGKVPKPINLPSQRLENHGLDPNVEIVPKGTLTWGSRSSAATPNVWVSSSVSSPNTDGSTTSPSNLSGRPSSGGSYTRPSTATSDKSHQTVSAVWGPNSRPSSASGILPSDQVPIVASRPRSAETRHVSSRMSSFGESAPESSAWGPSRIPEKLAASKLNTFSLSSGDFPTLGIEKMTPKSAVPQEGDGSLVRPVSASGRVNVDKEPVDFQGSGNESLPKGNMNAWRNDGPHPGSVTPQNSESWRRDQPPIQQSYPNTGALPPYQFEPWHGAHMVNPPEGMWYRGPPPGGMYRPEYGIFYPQIPGSPLPGSQAVVYGSMNGQPPYHAQPRVYEQDGPVMGMVVPQPTLYGQHQGQRPKVGPGDFHAEPSLPMVNDETRPRFKVLLKQHDRVKDDGPGEKKDQPTPPESKLVPLTEAPKRSSSFKKSSVLIERIESLNSKARVVDGRSAKEDQRKEGPFKDSSDAMNKIPAGDDASVDADHLRGERKSNGNSRPRLNDKRGEEWRNKSPGPLVAADDAEKCEEPPTVCDGAGKIGDKVFVVSSPDSVDVKAQHATMKEIARQRAKQLQKEEEERTREQKARALAKLEELNRRTSAAADSSVQPPPPPETPSHATAATVPPKTHRVNDAMPEDPASSAPPDHGKQAPQKRQHHGHAEEQHVIPDGVLVGSIIISSKHLISDSGSAVNTPAMAEKDTDASAAHPRKRNGNGGRVTRNRNKSDESTQKEKSPMEEGGPSKQPVEASQAMAEEEGSSKPAAQWKPQHARKMMRNPPTARLGEAAVIWAPVKSAAIKKETASPIEEAQSAAPDSQPTAKGDGRVDAAEQTRSKSKRAEMERYVPKPIIAQEVSLQTPMPTPEAPAGSTVQSTVDPKAAEPSRLGKNGKAQTSWRRRGPPEPPAPPKNAEEQQKDQAEERHPADSGEPAAAPPPSGERVNKGRRPPSRGNRSAGGTAAHARVEQDAGQLTTVVESDDAGVGTRGGGGGGDHPKSQWQLKSTQHSSSGGGPGGAAQKTQAQANNGAPLTSEPRAPRRQTEKRDKRVGEEPPAAPPVDPKPQHEGVPSGPHRRGQHHHQRQQKGLPAARLEADDGADATAGKHGRPVNADRREPHARHGGFYGQQELIQHDGHKPAGRYRERAHHGHHPPRHIQIPASVDQE